MKFKLIRCLIWGLFPMIVFGLNCCENKPAKTKTHSQSTADNAENGESLSPNVTQTPEDAFREGITL